MKLVRKLRLQPTGCGEVNMKRVSLSIITCSLIAAGLTLTSPAYAYYQDKFNPNSRTFNHQGGSTGSNYHYRQGFGSNSQFESAAHYYGANVMRRTAAFPDSRQATGKKVFIWDPQQLSWAAYDENGQLVRTGPGSSGSNYCPDLGHSCHTPAGTYHVYSKQGPGYRSKIFPMPRGGAPMPYAMFFSGGYAVHGSYEVPSFNASHGCVRVLPSDAEWLNNDFLGYGSTIIIKPYHGGDDDSEN
jgi:hypothetical protein